MSILRDDAALVTLDEEERKAMSSDDEESGLPVRKRLKKNVPVVKGSSPRKKGATLKNKPKSKATPFSKETKQATTGSGSGSTTVPIKKKPKAKTSAPVAEDDDDEDEDAVFKAVLEDDDDDMRCDEEFHGADSDDDEVDEDENEGGGDGEEVKQERPKHDGVSSTFYRQVDNDRKHKAHASKQGRLKLIDDEAEERNEIASVEKEAQGYEIDDFVRPDETIVRDRKSGGGVRPPGGPSPALSLVKRKLYPVSDEEEDVPIPAKVKALSSTLPPAKPVVPPKSGISSKPSTSPSGKARSLVSVGASPKAKLKLVQASSPAKSSAAKATTSNGTPSSSSSKSSSSSSSSTKSSPTASATKKRKAPAKNDVPEVRSVEQELWNPGTGFKYNKMEYVVSYRGLNAAFDKKNNKYAIDQCTPVMYSTGEVAGSKPKKYAMFLLYPFKSPHLVTDKDAIAIEKKLTDPEKKERFEKAKKCSNLDTTQGFARLLLFPKMYEEKLKRGDKSQFVNQTKGVFSNKCKDVMEKVLAELLLEEPEYLRQLFATHDKHWQACRAHENDHDIVVATLKTFERKTIQVLAVYMVLVSETYRAKIPAQVLELAAAANDDAADDEDNTTGEDDDENKGSVNGGGNDGSDDIELSD